MNDALIILIKNPVPGCVKTRLGRAIGNEGALWVYNLIVEYTREITRPLRCDKLVFYSDFIDTQDNWNPRDFSKHVQEGSDFGERMYNAFKIAFEHHQRVQIIGSDCYEITTKIIDDGFRELECNDVVLGPAEDGGYYLLGLNEMIPDLFREKAWSTDVVLEQTLADVDRLGLRCSFLDSLSDIDDMDDLLRSRLLEDHPEIASFVQQ
jgi:hypothetical protein